MDNSISIIMTFQNDTICIEQKISRYSINVVFIFGVIV